MNDKSLISIGFSFGVISNTPKIWFIVRLRKAMIAILSEKMLL